MSTDLSSINTRVGQLMASAVMMENECKRVMEESMKVQTDWEAIKRLQAHAGDAEKYKVALERIVELKYPKIVVQIAEDALGVEE